MEDDLQTILVSEEQIRQRINELGKEITTAYKQYGELTVIAIINGAIPFTADLIRAIDIPVRLDCMRVSSYRDDTKPVSDPELIDTLRLDIEDRHVILIDDILDTGKTFAHVVKLLKTRKPASLRLAALLEKKGRRKVAVKADYVGFQIPDEFVVGYGLDFAERYRNLRCIGVLKAELQNPPEWR
ncbi:MAG: hypoxanthine phosphoribosyltransferase [Verrucomicrobiota bacterium]|nr:hypoxanthine phosphoribosyltransferase [Verrucomicrobiota bacterium]